MRFLEAALEAAVGSPVRIEGAKPVAGGCLHEARRLTTSAGDFFAKWSLSGPPDIFVREASGLETLRLAGTSLVIPRVIAAREPEDGDPAFLILEYLAPGPKDDDALGRGLALIHKHRSDRFGFGAPSYCGATVQDNRWADRWPEFYADQRIRPLLKRIETRGDLPAADRSRYERLLERLPALLSKDPAPSLVHGDLWSGNVLWATRGPALVDPACAFADREMEFGITTLFGGLSPRAFSAYEEALPFAAGWRERNPLYQLYHLLNHVVLFGGGYGAQALEIVRRFVG
jgi:protein-ribulosamine 3-kinase